MRKFALYGLLVSVLVAALLSPFASGLPDGLERVAENLGFLERAHQEGAARAPLPDYAVRGLACEGLSSSLAGVAGTVVTFLGALALARLLRRKPD